MGGTYDARYDAQEDCTLEGIKQKRKIPRTRRGDLAGAVGLEPTTYGFGDRRSTN